MRNWCLSDSARAPAERRSFTLVIISPRLLDSTSSSSTELG